MILRNALVVGMAAAIALLACDSRSNANAGGTRDSSGVLIIENPAELPASVEDWTIDGPPKLTIDESKGPDHFIGHVGHVALLPAGRLAVVDWADTCIRVFNSSGNFVGRLGRGGDGPGDFRSLEWAAVVPSDSLAVFDHRARRFSIFGSLNQKPRHFTMDSSWAADVHGRLASGWWVLTRGIQEPRDGGLYRAPKVVALLADGGDQSIAIGTFPDVLRFVATAPAVQFDCRRPSGSRRVIRWCLSGPATIIRSRYTGPMGVLRESFGGYGPRNR